MQQPTFDPGLTQQYNGPLRRAINQDGSFNVVRQGLDWRDQHPYLKLVGTSWPKFFLLIVAAYTLVNVIFAFVYFALGPDALQGGRGSGALDRLLTSAFFSSQTLTTVGFGAIAPKSNIANLIAAMEALIGLLGFAVATGLLFGRVSRPSARIAFSERALISPYQDGLALMFRVTNRRTNSLMELEATVLMMTVDHSGGGSRRKYTQLKLEREKVMFFPLTWTVVHPIDVSSPLHEMTLRQMEEQQLEFMILIKAWDETFAQTVHQRFSYRFDEIVWNAKFTPAFAVDASGRLVLAIDKVGAYSELAATAAAE